MANGKEHACTRWAHHSANDSISMMAVNARGLYDWDFKQGCLRSCMEKNLQMPQVGFEPTNFCISKWISKPQSESCPDLRQVSLLLGKGLAGPNSWTSKRNNLRITFMIYDHFQTYFLNPHVDMYSKSFSKPPLIARCGCIPLQPVSVEHGGISRVYLVAFLADEMTTQDVNVLCLPACCKGCSLWLTLKGSSITHYWAESFLGFTKSHDSESWCSTFG